MVALWSGCWTHRRGDVGHQPCVDWQPHSYPTTLETYATLRRHERRIAQPGPRSQPGHWRPYAPNMVPRGDYARVLANFGRTAQIRDPPGHWFTILNYVSDHPELVKQFQGEGPVLDDLNGTSKRTSPWGPQCTTRHLGVGRQRLVRFFSPHHRHPGHGRTWQSSNPPCRATILRVAAGARRH